jgi:uncharacterized protein YecT (DUF1311 family)
MRVTLPLLAVLGCCCATVLLTAPAYTPAYAAVPVTDSARPKCNPAGNQQEMNACAVRDYQLADKELNKEYKKKIAGLSPADQDALRKEQRAWLKARDPKCKEAIKESLGGSIWTLEYHGCLTTATTDRTRVLRAWRN